MAGARSATHGVSGGARALLPPRSAAARSTPPLVRAQRLPAPASRPRLRSGGGNRRRGGSRRGRLRRGPRRTEAAAAAAAAAAGGAGQPLPGAAWARVVAAAAAPAWLGRAPARRSRRARRSTRSAAPRPFTALRLQRGGRIRRPSVGDAAAALPGGRRGRRAPPRAAPTPPPPASIRRSMATLSRWSASSRRAAKKAVAEADRERCGWRCLAAAAARRGGGGGGAAAAAAVVGGSRTPFRGARPRRSPPIGRG